MATTSSRKNEAIRGMVSDKIERLRKAIAGLNKYVDVVRTVAVRVVPTALREFEKGQVDVARWLEAAEGLANKPAAGPTGVFRTVQLLDQSKTAIASYSEHMLAPAILDRATSEMSMSYVQELRSDAAKIRERLAFPVVSEGDADVWADSLASEPAADVAKAYAAYADYADSATLIYTALLRIWKQRGVNIAWLQESAKDVSLGISPDSPAGIRRGRDERAGLHPLQQMGVTFEMYPEQSVYTDALPKDVLPKDALPKDALPKDALPKDAVLIDCTLPQSTEVVQYHIDNLVDFSTALKYGRLQYWTTGLNYKILERFRTIVTRPVVPAAAPKIAVPESAGLKVYRSVDGGNNYRLMALPPDASPGSWVNVGAGPRPRVERLGELLERAVTAKSSLLEDPEDFSKRYDEEVERGRRLIRADDLRRRLEARFAEKYDAYQPKTAEQFENIVLGRDIDSGGLYRNYIALAVGDVFRGAYAPSLKRREAGLLTGGRLGLGGAAERREILLTSVAQLGGSVVAVISRLLAGYSPFASKAEALFAGDVRDVRASAARLYSALLAKVFPARSEKVHKLAKIDPQLSRKMFAVEFDSK